MEVTILNGAGRFAVCGTVSVHNFCAQNGKVAIAHTTFGGSVVGVAAGVPVTLVIVDNRVLDGKCRGTVADDPAFNIRVFYN